MLRYDDGGEERPIEDPATFMRQKGIDSFIKHYFTFWAMRPQFPGQCMMIAYEDLVRDPEGKFTEMLDFLGYTVAGPEAAEAMQLALKYASMPALKQFEEQLGRSLANDRAAAGKSLMHGGESGKWRRHLDDGDVAFAEERLARFGLKLSDFVLG